MFFEYVNILFSAQTGSWVRDAGFGIVNTQLIAEIMTLGGWEYKNQLILYSYR